MNAKKEPEWTGEGDPAPSAWFLAPRGEVVQHRGRSYPASFRWTWTRDDGLQVGLDVRVDGEAGPVPVAVTIRAAEGITGGDYRQPVPSMVRTAAAAYAVDVTEEAPGSYRVAPVSGPVAVGRLTGRTDRDRLARIAEFYRRALAEGRGVTELIEESEKVSRSTAYGLIRSARAAGLLAPSRRGRKARSDDE